MRRADPAPADVDVDVDVDVEKTLEIVTKELTDEFGGRFTTDAVRRVVRDSYTSLVAHVPRTAWSYVRPWARQRLLGRASPTGREPSLAAILSMPPQGLRDSADVHAGEPRVVDDDGRRPVDETKRR